MKWPWISRLAYEALERERNTLRSDLILARDDLQQERQRYGELVGDVVSMRQTGFEKAPNYPEPAATAPFPGEITDALDRIGLTGGSRSQMVAWAARQLEKGAEAKDVAKELLAGGLVTVGEE